MDQNVSEKCKKLFINFSKNGPKDQEIDVRIKTFASDMDIEIGSSMDKGDIRLAAGNFLAGYIYGSTEAAEQARREAGIKLAQVANILSEIGILYHKTRLTGKYEDALELASSYAIQAQDYISFCAILQGATASELKMCEVCGGKGYTAEHSPGLNDHDSEGNCLGACPVQVQCEHCNGTGKVTASDPIADAVKAERERCADRAVLFIDEFDQNAEDGDFYTTSDIRAAILSEDKEA